MSSELGEWRRTHSNGSLRRADVGQVVTLMGWAQTRRDLGGLIFIDLRDREGITQVVFNPQEASEAANGAAQVRSEYVIAVRGIVAERPAGTVNPKLPTGDVEVRVRELRILNPAETPPFRIADDAAVDEAVRLRYRYLDLRRPSMFGHLALRHRLAKAVRDHLSREGFLEVETPMLIKSTPEGARDFLVPSRLHPGKFYVLPQSPQLFKQLLMVAGVERYFQIARCFRDEDGRADRGLCVPGAGSLSRREVEHLEDGAKAAGALGLVPVHVDQAGARGPAVRHLSSGSLAALQARLRAAPGDLLLFIADAPRVASAALGRLRLDLGRRLGLVPDHLAFLWVTKFPLFERGQGSDRLAAMHHPFTAPADEDVHLLGSDPLAARAKAYDLVLNGVELGGGSIRIHRRELQARMFDLLGITPEQARDRFGFLLDAFQYGAPPHGGIALGLDRAVMMLAGQETIREASAGPQTQNAADRMTGAPS